MRYIPKGSTEPPVLSTAKANGEDYASFGRKSALNEILREEQGCICCYCQQEIRHYQGAVSAGSSHNEHLQPQHAYRGLDMDYGNLFASCNADGKSGYCGHHKDDKEIANFIQRGDCRKHFKYNVIGEILPNGVYSRWEEYTKNYSALSTSQQKAADAIQILHLNHPFLVAERKKTIGDILALAQGISPLQAQYKIAVINNQTPLVRFVEAILYFLNKKIP